MTECERCGRPTVAVLQSWAPGVDIVEGDVCRSLDKWPRHYFVHSDGEDPNEDQEGDAR